MPEIKILGDSPTTEDVFGFESYVEIILDAINNFDVRSPLTISIYGSWGSGKTSLMKMLEKMFNGYLFSIDKGLEDELNRGKITEKLKNVFKTEGYSLSNKATTKTKEKWDKWIITEKEKFIVKKEYGKLNIYKDDNDVKTIWFNAWAHRREETIGLALLQQVLSSFKYKDRLKRNFKTVNKSLGKLLADVALRKTIGMSFKDAKSHFKNSIEIKSTLKDDFEKAIDVCLPADKRLVVFIDDLDRCQPEETIKILEVIKLFLDVPRCVFVIGVAKEVIEQGIEVIYKIREQGIPISGQDYIEKIIQVPFTLPPIREKDMIKFIKSFGYLFMFSWDKVPGDDNERLLRFLMGDLNICWTKNAKIRKSNDGKIIHISKNVNSAEIMIDEKAEKATLKTSDGRTYDLKVKKENGKLNILGISEKEEEYAKIVAKGTKYNPRKVKTFLNTLRIRREIAHKSGGNIEPIISAKLLVIEYTFPEFYSEYVVKHRKDDFICKFERLAKREDDEELSKELKGFKMLSEAVQKYSKEYELTNLLQYEPSFCGIDIEPYIYLSGKPPEEVFVPEESILDALISLDPGKREKALSEIKGNQKLVDDEIITKLEDRDKSIRGKAVEALGITVEVGIKKGDKAVEPLIEALKDKDSRDVRWKAVGALGMIGSAKAAEALTKALGDEYEPVRIKALDALLKIDAEAVEPLIEALLKDENTTVRCNSAAALRRIGIDSPKAKDALKWVSNNDESLNVRSFAKNALKEIEAIEAKQKSK